MFCRKRTFPRTTPAAVVVCTLLALPISATFAPAETMDIYFHAQGVDQDSRLGFSVAGIGDVNHDGFDDIAVVAVKEGVTFVYYGGVDHDAVPDLQLPGLFFSILRLGDINGDGNTDVAASRGNEVWIFYGNNLTLDTVPGDTLRSDLPGSSGFGITMASGDYDGDSIVDFVIIDHDSNVPGAVFRILFYSGIDGYGDSPRWSIGYADNHHVFRGCAAINVDADPSPELVVGIEGREVDSLPGRLWVFDSPDLDSIVDLEFYSPPVSFDPNRYTFGREVVNVGDFNNDGHDDLGAVAGVQGFVFFGGVGIWDSIPDVEFNQFTTTMVGAGDVNMDGTADIFAGDMFYQGQNGRGELFLGGNAPDGEMDFSVEESDLPPHFLENIGLRIGAAGDFNGDGGDDVILRSGNLAIWDYGEVFVLGLEQISTSIDDQYSGGGATSDPVYTAPTGLNIYPNPFNSKVNIVLRTSEGGRLTLSIFDILGRLVAELADRHLADGEHAFSWDAQLANGAAAPSGMYFVVMKLGNETRIKRVVLLK